jgi:DNA replication protein DnaC
MHNNIESNAKTLKLAYIKTNFKEIIKEAVHTDMDCCEFLNLLLENEVNARKKNSIKTKMRAAKFNEIRYLEDYDISVFDKEIQKNIKILKDLSFIDRKENIILFGNPGVGKSHLATALGVKACMENKNVLFVNVPNLIIELKEAMSQNQVHRYKKQFQKYDLVILDELGYISFDKEGSEILFNLLSNRNEQGSIIITTNLIFERWEEIFKDPILTGAVVDRLAHKAHILNLSGESYRIKETEKMLKK